MPTPYDKLWEKALKTLQFRMTSREELRRKLLGAFPQEEAQVSRVLDEMARVELLNDRRYAEQLIAHLTQRPIGRLKLKLEIRKRGLDESLADSLLLEAGYDEKAEARKALEGKEGQVRETDPRKLKFKLMNFLRSRGFTDATIYSALKNDD